MWEVACMVWKSLKHNTRNLSIKTIGMRDICKVLEVTNGYYHVPSLLSHCWQSPMDENYWMLTSRSILNYQNGFRDGYGQTSVRKDTATREKLSKMNYCPLKMRDQRTLWLRLKQEARVLHNTLADTENQWSWSRWRYFKYSGKHRRSILVV